MSLKHHKRTRAEKLANRGRPIMGFDNRPAPIAWVERRSKYAPHIGLKEQERAKRCYMDDGFGQPRLQEFMGRKRSVDLHRCAPVMRQINKHDRTPF